MTYVISLACYASHRLANRFHNQAWLDICFQTTTVSHFFRSKFKRFKSLKEPGALRPQSAATKCARTHSTRGLRALNWNLFKNLSFILGMGSASERGRYIVTPPSHWLSPYPEWSLILIMQSGCNLSRLLLWHEWAKLWFDCITIDARAGCIFTRFH